MCLQHSSAERSGAKACQPPLQPPHQQTVVFTPLAIASAGVVSQQIESCSLLIAHSLSTLLEGKIACHSLFFQTCLEGILSSLCVLSLSVGRSVSRSLSVSVRAYSDRNLKKPRGSENDIAFRIFAVLRETETAIRDSGESRNCRTSNCMAMMEQQLAGR